MSPSRGGRLAAYVPRADGEPNAGLSAQWARAGLPAVALPPGAADAWPPELQWTLRCLRGLSAAGTVDGTEAISSV